MTLVIAAAANRGRVESVLKSGLGIAVGTHYTVYVSTYLTATSTNLT